MKGLPSGAGLGWLLIFVLLLENFGLLPTLRMEDLNVDTWKTCGALVFVRELLQGQDVLAAVIVRVEVSAGRARRSRIAVPRIVDADKSILVGAVAVDAGHNDGVKCRHGGSDPKRAFGLDQVAQPVGGIALRRLLSQAPSRCEGGDVGGIEPVGVCGPLAGSGCDGGGIDAEAIAPADHHRRGRGPARHSGGLVREWDIAVVDVIRFVGHVLVLLELVKWFSPNSGWDPGWETSAGAYK